MAVGGGKGRGGFKTGLLGVFVDPDSLGSKSTKHEKTNKLEKKSDSRQRCRLSN